MKKIISTKNAPAAIGPYSQAVEVNNMLFISGQIPVNPAEGTVPEGVQAQTKQVMENIGAILKEAGYTYDNIVKCTCFLTDMNNFVPFNEVYGKYFTSNPPARAAFGVVSLPKGVLVEVEAIAAK
jgi:2-iminobutanoate/2-iminopropanoate deaminase